MTWTIVTDFIELEEAEQIAKELRNKNIRNIEKKAKFIRLSPDDFNDPQLWRVEFTPNFSDLSDDEFRRAQNMGLL